VTFSLSRRPGSVAILDDDPDFLASTRMLLARHWWVETFADPDIFAGHLAAEAPFWEADVWLQQDIVDRWRRGGVPLAQGVVDYWRKHTERYAGTRVCIVDYRLQDRTGLDVLRNLGSWSGRRLLISGFADRDLPRTAFASGLVDGFLSKAAAPLPTELLRRIEEYQDEADPRVAELWRDTLSAAQLEVLAQDGVDRALRRVVDGRFVEHFVLAEPFGILGLTGQGQLGWVPLHIGDAPALMTDLALRRALQLPPEQAREAVPVAYGSAGRLHGALFDLAAEPASDMLSGYRPWLRRQTLAAGLPL
jgi:FixJ family two-component response regulator